jgi:hypothetical protein
MSRVRWLSPLIRYIPNNSTSERCQVLRVSGRFLWIQGETGYHRFGLDYPSRVRPRRSPHISLRDVAVRSTGDRVWAAWANKSPTFIWKSCYVCDCKNFEFSLLKSLSRCEKRGFVDFWARDIEIARANGLDIVLTGESTFLTSF